jgi:hypothetical protein
VGFRTNLISKNAAAHMEAGEEIARVAIVRAATMAGGARAGGANFAVAATPKNVYVFKLGGLGFGKVAERVAKVPIKKAVVERHTSFLTVGRRGQGKPEHVFSMLPGGSPKRLAAYVAERGGGGGRQSS